MSRGKKGEFLQLKAAAERGEASIIKEGNPSIGGLCCELTACGHSQPGV